MKVGALKGHAGWRQERSTGMTTRQAEADAADIGDLYRQHAETVARWVARLGGPLMDVDDAVHEVFMIAQRRRPSTHGPAQITTWLYRVTTKVVSHRRRKDRLRRWLGGSADDVAAGMMAVEPSPADALEAKERSLLVYRVLDRLSERQRAVLILFEMEGLSGEEIAALYHAKVATVWVWLHRARASFLAQLERLEAKEPS
jgi:RNA polymerase sigma-70 factor (ECF subfamily)